MILILLYCLFHNLKNFVQFANPSHSHMDRIPPSTTCKEQFMKIIYIYFMLSSEKSVSKKLKFANPKIISIL